MGDAATAAFAANWRLPEPPPSNCKLEVRVVREFEASLRLSWTLEPKTALDAFADFVVEMVIDHEGHSKKQGQEPLRPPKGAMVKRVSMGKDLGGNIQSMPTGRRFFIAVVGKLPGGQERRSPWIHAETLSPDTRENICRSVDPMNIPRASCELCSCPGYVPMFSANSLSSHDNMLCRHCGCRCTDHVAVQVQEILSMREEKLRSRLGRKEVKALPDEALEWDTRECALWAWTDGAVHPRLTMGLHRPALSEGAQLPLGGPEGLSGKKGRVSVVTPTTESRHRFHKALWAVFEAQTWPDKELVVVETYAKEHSAFFAELAKKDPRVHYIKFHRQQGHDWSIGLKRNIGTHLATGEFIANFDDDDLYAPEYLTAMVNRLEDLGKQAIKLSSWFIYNEAKGKWAFCDPIAWGLSHGLDEGAKEVKNWAYGYGFSYVFRRKAGLDVWYEDINLGEDFNFVTQLQHRRGMGSVALFHDDFGICLHVQHGGNTSDSIPLRSVDREEAEDLDVVELAPRFAHADPGALATTGMLGSATPPSQRRRRVRAKLAGSWLEAECAVSATASEVLRCLSEQAGRDCASLEVYRVPPRGEAADAVRDRAAVDVLGLGFLVRMPGVEENIKPGGKCGQQWRQLLDSACRPMRSDDRIGLRTRELWLREPEAGAEQLVADSGEREDFIVVGVSCQKTTAKKFFSLSSNAVQVRVPVGTNVGNFRAAFGWTLPATAVVMEERPGKGMVPLQESDPVPEFVTVTDFKGQVGFYTKFSVRETSIALQIIKVFFTQPENQQRLDELDIGAQGSPLRYSALVSNLLANEVYPPILRRFDLPEEKPLQLVMHAMETVLWSKHLVEMWLETELLMRNELKIKEAVEHCHRLEISVAEVVYRVYMESQNLPKVQEKAGEELQKLLGTAPAQEEQAGSRPEEHHQREEPVHAPAESGGGPQGAAAGGGSVAEAGAEAGGPEPEAPESAVAAEEPPVPAVVKSVQQRPVRPGRGGLARGRLGRGAREAPQQAEPSEPLYEVIHERVILRRHPSTTATTVGTVTRGAILRGTPHDVEGSPWLLLDVRSRGRYANSRMDAWALIHGGRVGLGDLLLPVSEERVEVVIRHGYLDGEVRLLVAATCTILEVKRALAQALGREMPAAKLVTKSGAASFFANCKDAEPLGERRELLLLGEKLG